MVIKVLHSTIHQQLVIPEVQFSFCNIGYTLARNGDFSPLLPYFGFNSFYRANILVRKMIKQVCRYLIQKSTYMHVSSRLIYMKLDQVQVNYDPNHLCLLWKITACYFLLVIQSLLFWKRVNFWLIIKIKKLTIFLNNKYTKYRKLFICKYQAGIILKISSHP